MLNMALLNIMSTSSSSMGSNANMPDTSDYNILGLLSPALDLEKCGHWPSCVFIWNRFLTTFQMYFRCEDEGCRPENPRIGVGGVGTICGTGEKIRFNSPFPSVGINQWGVATSFFATGASYRELMAGHIDMKIFETIYEKEIGTIYNAYVSGYANYWEHLPPLPTQLNLLSTASLAGFFGGTVWQAGLGTLVDGRPLRAATFFPYANYTPLVNGAPRNPDYWLCYVVPVRGLTNFHKHEFANQMMIGFLQLEYPNQIGYGLSYTFGIAKNPECLPKKSNTKCGGQTNGLMQWSPAPKLFEGFAPFNLDNFLQPFIRAGKLRSYEDASKVYSDLMRLMWPTDSGDYGKAVEKTTNTTVGVLYKSYQSIWQGLIDGWLEQPYKDIFLEIGGDPFYYINALQTHYPTECNFHSILGCGRSFDAGVRMNSAICAMVDALSVFKALSTYPDFFPVDLPALVAAT